MSDPYDSYLSNCLKNWTARQALPKGGRRALLENAASTTKLSNEKPGFRLYFKPHKRQVLHPFPPGNWLKGPITQTPLWSFHLAFNVRLTT
jgi:hypothetical protein